MKTILFVLLLAGLLCGAVSCFAETAEPAMEIPAEYKTAVPDGGTVTRIEYPSRDYARDSAEITKPAALYLPPDYSETEHYDVLVLCHGIGGTEWEWGFLNKNSIGKNIVDHLILNGEIKPVIIVMPNGRSTADCGNTDWSNMQAFYSCGQEIRNDLLPYIDANYATYGSLTPDDPDAGRPGRRPESPLDGRPVHGRHADDQHRHVRMHGPVFRLRRFLRRTDQLYSLPDCL